MINMIVRLDKYKNYRQYINHQKEKTTKNIVIKNHIDNWNKRVKYFEDELKYINIKKNSKCLCIASRYGEEVEALKNLGFDAVGIDLVECKPLTIKMDMHNLKFNNNTFDFVYTNAIDHSYYIDKVIKEMIRVLKNNGILMIKIELNNQNEYESYLFESESDINSIVNKNLNSYELENFTKKGEGKCIWHVFIYNNIIK